VRNIEIKARLGNLPAARDVAQAIATDFLGVQEQTDTYFLCPRGRLKLREIAGAEAQLICYQRPDQDAPKASDYQLVPIAEPAALKAALEAALGLRGVVRKRREIFLHHNVRIHLDEVQGRGTFLEFEAVLGPGLDDRAGQAQLQELLDRFGILPDDLLSGSYGDAVSSTEG
jgi:predicted adenylyl cyclase CyaB